MSAYVYMTKSGVVTTIPCVLKSIIVANDGQSQAYVDVYDAQRAETGYKVARCYCPARLGDQYRWEGLELTRGLYIEFDNHADHCTVEWAPVGYPGAEPEWLEHLREALGRQS